MVSFWDFIVQTFFGFDIIHFIDKEVCLWLCLVTKCHFLLINGSK